MKIGISGPILVNSLKQHLNQPERYLDLGMGGTAINSLINGLIKLGNKVSVYTLDERIKEKLILRGDNLTIYIGHSRISTKCQVLDNFNLESRQIRDFIIEDKPEIVNAHWSYEYAMGAIASKYPHLITLRDDSWEILMYFKDVFRLARLILDVRVKLLGNNFCANSSYLQSKFKFNREIPVVPNSIDEEEIAMEGKIHPSEKFRIVSSMNGWTKRKNPLAALMAFKLLRAEYGNTVEYHLFGSGYEKEGPGFQRARENGLLDGVFFHGQISYQEMMDLLSDYQIMLHPSLEESFGNTLIEAMAKGLPVVGGESSGAVPWVLNYGKNGILVNVKSPEEMFKGLKKLITNKSLYEQLSHNGVNYVMDNFSSARIAKKYMGIYEDIIFQKKRIATDLSK